MEPSAPTRKLRLTITLALLAGAVWPSILVGQAPRTIGFQGRLATSTGDPVADGLHTMTFTIYDDSVGGVALWFETKDVATTDGIFATELGSDSTLTGFSFNAELWLGVKVGSDPEMTPRTSLMSVPTAFALATGPGLRYSSIDGTAFSPTEVDNTSWYSSSFGGASIGAGPSEIMDAVIQVPDGVGIKEFSAYIFDFATADLDCALNLTVHDLVGGTKTSIQVANVSSSGDAGWDWYSTTSLSGLTPVSMENRRMHLAVFCQAVNGTWTAVNSDLRIGAAVVGYE